MQQAEFRSILEERQSKRKAEHTAVRDRIDAVLTEEQRTARDEQIGRRIERRVARIADRLDLTAEQETELRMLMTENRDPTDWRSGEMRERLTERYRKDGS